MAREHIHQRTLDSYIDLYKFLNTHPNPEVGHYFERSWVAVFHPVPETCMCKIPGNKMLYSPDSKTSKYTLSDLVNMMRSAQTFKM